MNPNAAERPMQGRIECIRALVVGGAGFIGSHLVDRLLDHGADVRVLDSFVSGSEQNLSRGLPHIDLIRGDMRNEDVLIRAMRGRTHVFLLAALPSVARSIEDPAETHDVNVNGVHRVLLSARAAGVERLVFASSAAVYGKSRELPKHEGLPPHPVSPYGVHKLVGETYCRVFRDLFDLPTVSLRYFNVFGPRQNVQSHYSSVIPRFVGCALRGDRPVVYGSGRQSRDFVFVENVVAANLLAAGADPGPGPFNIGTGRSTSILDLLDAIGEIFGCELDPQFLPPREGDVDASEADISAARMAMGYTPLISIERGLSQLADWLREDAA